jgi:hypothetical protein
MVWGIGFPAACDAGASRKPSTIMHNEEKLQRTIIQSPGTRASMQPPKVRYFRTGVTLTPGDVEPVWNYSTGEIERDRK